MVVSTLDERGRERSRFVCPKGLVDAMEIARRLVEKDPEPERCRYVLVQFPELESEQRKEKA